MDRFDDGSFREYTRLTTRPQTCNTSTPFTHTDGVLMQTTCIVSHIIHTCKHLHVHKRLLVGNAFMLPSLLMRVELIMVRD